MSASPSQLAALKWLRNRHGDGVFDRHQVLTAAGERAPVMRSTWTKLEKLGLVERYNKGRLRVTAAGDRIDVSKIEESQ
jgi:ribosomal protein S19E (S16A)